MREDGLMPVWLGLLLGIVLAVFTWTIIVFTVVVPRPLRGPGRLSVDVNRATRWIFFGVSRLARTYEGKDAVLASIGAVALLAQLLVWLVLLGVASVVMLVPYTHDLGAAVSQVGAAMFSLGARAPRRRPTTRSRRSPRRRGSSSSRSRSRICPRSTPRSTVGNRSSRCSRAAPASRHGDRRS